VEPPARRVSKPRGTVPAAFSATGQDVPPPADLAERTLAEVIGEAVGLHLAKLLGPVLAHLAGQQPSRPGCIVCAARVKRAEKAHKIAIRNANAAAEDGPEVPDMGVTESFTEGNRGPVCWGCYEPDVDGPYEGPSLNDLLPPPAD
jgi:hypothetical protein